MLEPEDIFPSVREDQALLSQGGRFGKLVLNGDEIQFHLCS